jgi:putative membrane protein
VSCAQDVARRWIHREHLGEVHRAGNIAVDCGWSQEPTITMLAALMSALHLLGLGVGLGSVFARGRALRAVGAGDAAAVGRVLFADTLWGIAALLWIATGLTRLFGALDKTLDFYLYNVFFWIKMGLFLLVFALEMTPMMTFVQWRKALRAGRAPDTSRVALLGRLNHAELAIVLAIPFAAAAMARGLWLVP